MTARLLRSINGGADMEVTCDFGAGFVDITNYVGTDDIKIVRGRRGETSTSEPARLTLTVNNTDGRFTSGNPDSPYWPGNKFRTPIRIRVRHPHTSGTWYTRFTGMVDEWPVVWPADVADTDDIAWSPVSASGQMRRLTQGSPLRSGIGDQAAMNAASGSLIGYWPLTDGANATRFAKAAGLATVSDFNRSPSGVSNAVVAGPPGDPALLPELTYQDGAGYVVSAAMGTQLPSVVGQTVEVWWRWGHAVVDVGLHSPPYLIRVEQAEPSALTWQMKATLYDTSEFDAPGVPIATVTGAALTADQVSGWIHSVLTFDNGVGSTWDLSLYTNGVADGTDTVAATSTSLLTSIYAYDRASTQADDGPTAIGHLHLYLGVMSSTDVADHYQIGSGYVGELASDRVIRVCGDAGLGVDATAALGAALGAQPVGSLLDVLRDCETADRGFLYEALDGNLAFQSVSQRYNPTAYLSLSASAELINELSPVADDQGYVNGATASRPQGSSATFTDQDQVDTYGEYHKDVTVNVADDAQLYPVASAVVGASSDPSLPRFPQFGFRFAQSADSSKLASWLVGEPLGALLALTSLPNQLPDSTASLFVEGYTETWGYAVCQVVANCSNADPFTRIFTIEGAAPLGTLGMSGQTVNTGINASATSLSMATAAGDVLLSTAGGDYPVVLINTATGERFTATACSGGSSPQTLTITRGSESTTAKAMTVGDVLDVAHPALLAL